MTTSISDHIQYEMKSPVKRFIEIYHGRDPFLPRLHKLVHQEIRYDGDEKGQLALDAMHLLFRRL